MFNNFIMKNKLGFNTFNELGSTVVSGTINENHQKFERFVVDTQKKQSEVLKLKEVNTQQLKTPIKL